MGGWDIVDTSWDKYKCTLELCSTQPLHMSNINQYADYNIKIIEKLEVVCYAIAVAICGWPSTADEVLAEMCSDFVQHPTLPFFSGIFIHALTQEPYIILGSACVHMHSAVCV